MSLENHSKKADMAVLTQTLMGTLTLMTSSQRTRSSGPTLMAMDGVTTTSGRTPPWPTKKTLACSSPFVSSEGTLSLRLPASGPTLTVMVGAITKAVPIALTTSHCALRNGTISMPMDLAIMPLLARTSPMPVQRSLEPRRPTMNLVAPTPITTAYQTTLTRARGIQKFRKVPAARLNAALPPIRASNQTMVGILLRF